MCGTLQVVSVTISAVAGNGAGGFNFKSVICFSKILNFQYLLWSVKLSTAFSLKVVLDTTAQIEITKYCVIYDRGGWPWPDAHQATLSPHLNQAGGKNKKEKLMGQDKDKEIIYW